MKIPASAMAKKSCSYVGRETDNISFKLYKLDFKIAKLASTQYLVEVWNDAYILSNSTFRLLRPKAMYLSKFRWYYTEFLYFD